MPNPGNYEENGILAQLRKDGTLNQDIADHLGVTRTTVANWENKGTWPFWTLTELGFSVVYDYDETIAELQEANNLIAKLEEALAILGRQDSPTDPAHVLERKQKLQILTGIL
jgi:transcriptional regulator with XRE-family HTH domain